MQNYKNSAILSPTVMDFLREATFYNGIVLFIEDDNLNINSKSEKLLLRSTLLYSLSAFFKLSVYETWCILNS